MISVDGYAQQGGEDLSVDVVLSGPRFFETIGVPLVRGRGLSAGDVFQIGAQTASNRTGALVVNESMAQRFFGAADPIGRHIRVWSGTYEIVGVARNTKYANLREESAREIYVPYFDLPHESIGVLLRSSGNPSAVVAGMYAAIKCIDPKVQVVNVHTVEDFVDRAVLPERLISHVAGGFGLFALLLAGLGLSALLACWLPARRATNVDPIIALRVE